MSSERGSSARKTGLHTPGKPRKSAASAAYQTTNPQTGKSALDAENGNAAAFSETKHMTHARAAASLFVARTIPGTTADAKSPAPAMAMTGKASGTTTMLANSEYGTSVPKTQAVSGNDTSAAQSAAAKTATKPFHKRMRKSFGQR